MILETFSKIKGKGGQCVCQTRLGYMTYNKIVFHLKYCLEPSQGGGGAKLTLQEILDFEVCTF